MKKIVLIIACFTVCYTTPINLNAALWNYNVNGTIQKDNADQIFNVTGNIVIDDTLRMWSGGSQAPPAPPGLENAQFSYFIPEYSLEINEYSFLGSAGNFYMERFELDMGDIMWFLEDGSGDWTSWTGESFNFFHADMTPYDLFNEWDVLAPIIQLTSLDYLYFDPILGGCENIYTDIVLTRTSAVPIPHAVWLLGSGLIGIVGVRRKFQK